MVESEWRECEGGVGEAGEEVKRRWRDDREKEEVMMNDIDLADCTAWR